MTGFEVSVSGVMPDHFDPARIHAGSSSGAHWAVTHQGESSVRIQASGFVSALLLGWDVLWLERDADGKWVLKVVSRSRELLLTLGSMVMTFLLVMTVLTLAQSKDFSYGIQVPPLPRLLFLAIPLVLMDAVTVPLILRSVAFQAAVSWLERVTGSGGGMDPQRR